MFESDNQKKLTTIYFILMCLVNLFIGITASIITNHFLNKEVDLSKSADFQNHHQLLIETNNKLLSLIEKHDRIERYTTYKVTKNGIKCKVGCNNTIGENTAAISEDNKLHLETGSRSVSFTTISALI